jgi:hypothetical protein
MAPPSPPSQLTKENPALYLLNREKKDYKREEREVV